MVAKLLVEKKRDGHALGAAEIRSFVEDYVKGDIPDYQVSAMLMAICCRGMTRRETSDLTDVMLHSGRTLSWEGVTADKHSTGGVGDKLSLVIQPLAAACGLKVPSLTGRGLGITGGTADKMETIPGFSAALPLDAFQRVVDETGLALAMATEEIAPADRKLYALRDASGTVPSLALITASILSKKLAEGSGTLVFDVKAGSGAFMKSTEEATELATWLTEGATTAGRRAAALVTDMDAPLGYAVGNANEVLEALAMLAPEGARAPFDPAVRELCVEFAAAMVAKARELPLDEAREQCRENLANGAALQRFRAMVAAQGGDLDRFARFIEKPVFKFRIQATRSGYVTAIDAARVGRVALELGAGHLRLGDRIDPRAGVELAVKRGDRVALGAPLATLVTSFAPDPLETCAAELVKAFQIGSEAPAEKNLILARIGI